MTEEIQHAMNVLKKAMAEDTEYAHTWHCNLAQSFLTSLASKQEQEFYTRAQEGATRFMSNVFGVKTSSVPPVYKEVEVETDRVSEGHEAIRKQRLTDLLSQTLNSVSAENGSNTPDFILAQYLYSCLEVFDKTNRLRQEWYGVHLAPGGLDLDPGLDPMKPTVAESPTSRT